MDLAQREACHLLHFNLYSRTGLARMSRSSTEDTIERAEPYLISIKNANQLVGRDGHSWRVDLAQAVVQIARLSVHFPNGPLASANVHKVFPQVVDPVHPTQDSRPSFASRRSSLLSAKLPKRCCHIHSSGGRLSNKVNPHWRLSREWKGKPRNAHSLHFCGSLPSSHR